MPIRKFAQSAFTAGAKVGTKVVHGLNKNASTIASHADIVGKVGARDIAHRPEVLHDAIIAPAWSATKHRIETIATEIEPVDFSAVANGAFSLSQKFMESFIQAHKEKEERAEHMVGTVIREASRKTGEILSMSAEEQIAVHEQLQSAHSDYKDTKGQIKNIQKAAGFVEKALGSALAEVITSKIDPQTLDKFCKTLRTTARVASSIAPPLRVLNNLVLAYDAAKILYPDHIQELEDYIVSNLESHQETLTQAISEKSQSFKARLNMYKQHNDLKLAQEEIQEEAPDVSKTIAQR